MALDVRQLVILMALFTDVVMAECSAGCTSCSVTTCLKCESSYYSSIGFCSACPEQCTSCNGYDDCTSCTPGKWGSNIQCQFTCNNNCHNNECQYDTGYCIQCKPGLYGPQCRQDCSDCEGGLCDLRRCTHGCKPGYYEYKTQSQALCQKCSSDCKYCKDASTCLVCNDGFHLYQFYANGKTVVSCVRCSLGLNCSNYCVIQNCNQCQIQNDALVCTDCPEGFRFNGNICIPSTTNCSQGCFSFCDDEGICLGSCNAGWTGEKCSGKCSDQCLTCNKSNRDICQQCNGDFFTVSCNVACNPSCITEEGKQTCRLNDGFCFNGCERTFWGPVCDQSCSSGCVDSSISPVCERSNGSCKYGCKDGYYGEKCVITITSETQVKSEATTTTQKQISTQHGCEENGGCRNNFIEGFFSGLATSIILTVITVILFHLRRRFIAMKLKANQDSERTIEMPTYYNEDFVQTNEIQEAANETNNYERLDNTRNTDNVYNDLEMKTVQ